MVECYVHDHHPLNLSDHLPLTISLELKIPHESPEIPLTKINWSKVNGDELLVFSQEVSRILSPHITDSLSPTIPVLNSEISQVCQAIRHISIKIFPMLSNRGENVRMYLTQG